MGDLAGSAPPSSAPSGHLLPPGEKRNPWQRFSKNRSARKKSPLSPGGTSRRWHSHQSCRWHDWSRRRVGGEGVPSLQETQAQVIGLAQRTPHPPLRSTFSPREGRRKGRRRAIFLGPSAARGAPSPHWGEGWGKRR